MLAACPLLAFAQKADIRVAVAGGAGEQVMVIPPQQGEYFSGAAVQPMLDSNGVMVLPNREKVPGIYHFVFNGIGLYKLYVRPGKSYSLTLEKAKKDSLFSVTCPDAEAQQVFNRSMKEFYQETGMRWYKEDSLFAHNKSRALARRDSVLQLFRNLHASGKMDDGFFAAAQKVNNAYHAAILGATLIMPVFKAVYKKDQPGYSEAALREMDANWKELPAISDVHDRSQAVSMEFYDYVNNLWATMYLRGVVSRMKDPAVSQKTREEAELYHKDIIAAHFKGPMREYVLASWLGDRIVGAKFYEFIPQEYAAFSKSYPKSKFNALLAKGAREVKDYRKSVAAGFSAAHRFVEHPEKLSTVKELAAAFPGKTLYVDLWATWCSPCKAAFAYNKPLHAMLEKNGAEALYISIDRDMDEKKWKEMIMYYDLKGYHIRATGALNKDITSVFGKAGTLTIPRYAIFKDGEVILGAKPPARVRELEAQLKDLTAAK